MSTLGIDGLISGLDTTALINQLMQVEAGPQTLLKQKQGATQSLVSGLQALNTKIASLATTAQKAADPESWSAWQATSSAASVTASAGATAQPGTLSFHVDQVATTQMSLSNTFTDVADLFPTQPPTITVKASDGTLVTVHPASGTLSEVTKAVNDAADAGIKATVVRVSAEPPTYRLQFTGTSTGTGGAFEVYAGTADDVTNGTATRIDGNLARAADDAEITLWKGVVGLEQTFTQSSNTFSGLMTGVDVTVSEVTGPEDDPVTITVGRDSDALSNLAKDLVGGLNLVLSEIASRTRTTTTTNADGTVSVTGGLFSGDSSVRQIQQEVLTAGSSPAEGLSPAEVGIVIGKDGQFTFDEEKFATALAADPAKVQSMVSEIAGRVATVAERASEPHTGSLTLKIQGQESLVKDMGLRIESWDQRLELRRAGLERTYAALEVTLSGLQSQSSWLAGQLAGLPSWSNSK